MPTETGIRDLKTHLSEYLRQVKAGHSITITEHGKPIGRIIPYTDNLMGQLATMQQAGLLTWSGEKLPTLTPIAKSTGTQVSDLLLEDRE